MKVEITDEQYESIPKKDMIMMMDRMAKEILDLRSNLHELLQAIKPMSSALVTNTKAIRQLYDIVTVTGLVDIEGWKDLKTIMEEGKDNGRKQD